MNIKRTFFSIVLVFAFTFNSWGQSLLPRPVPPRLVNDFTGILTSGQVDALERKLVAFSDSTSTQIAIVIVNDLQGYDRSEFAYKVASEWGVGQKGTNNGLLILVKPKTPQSGGRTFIAPGSGLEGVIPDIICGEIIDREMIPRFRADDYYGGLDSATNVIMALASKEYTAEAYGKKGGSGKDAAAPIGGLLFLIFIVVIILASVGSNNKNLGSRGSKGLPFWLLMSMMGSGHSHGGSWGGFSGGGGGFSGGGGGFGGFGGGGFGGGGAGGSW